VRQHMLSAALALSLGIGAAHANKVETPFVACGKAPNETAIAACQAEALKTAEAELASTMKAALAAIDKASTNKGVQRKGWKSDLRDEQRLWLALREKECVALIAWEMDRGPGFPAASLGCKVAKTEGRIQNLKARLSLP
jgi:uncharacterized protein YecT (DUF1311 family)